MILAAECTARPRGIGKPAPLLFMALLLLVLGGLPLGAQSRQSPALPAFERAEAFAFDQNHRAARVELLNAVANDPNWAPAHVALAITSLRLFDPLTAEEELRKAVELGAAPSQVRHLLGESLWLQGRYDEALVQLESDDIVPDHRAYAARIAARVYLDQGDLSAAGAAFDRALAAGGDDAPLWTDIGRFRLVAGNLAGAVQAADRAIAIDAGDVRALEFRGRLIRTQFGLRAALPWFEQALTQSGDDVPLLIEYGATLGDLGRHRDMLKVARKIVALEPGNPRGYFMQAVIAARAHRFALARRFIILTDGKMQDVPAMMLLSGAVEFGLGNDRTAAGHWARLAERQPMNAQAAMLAARALYRAGDPGAAADAMVRHGIDPSNSYANMVMARALEAQGEPGQAAQYLNRAQTPDQETLAPVYAAGDGPAGTVRKMLAGGDFNGALATARSLQGANGGVPDASLLLGDVLAQAGDRAAALKAYRQAGALDSSPELVARLAAQYRALGDAEGERTLLGRFLRSDPSDLQARRFLADLDAAIGRPQAAAILYRDLLAVLGPNDASLQIAYAQALLALDRPDDALGHARMAYHVQPGNPLVVNIYGYIALEAGATEEARQILEKAVALLPGNALAKQHLRKARKALRDQG